MENITNKTDNENPIKTKIAHGIMWNFFQLFANQGLEILIKIVLARLLLPEHFGIVGMAVIFSSLFSAISDAGLGSALIRFKKEKITEAHYYTGFWATFVFNIFLYLVLAIFISPLAAWFYKEPILLKIIPVIGISLVANSLNVIPKVIISRKLDFKSLSIIGATANFFGGAMALAFAFLGAGVWSIVLQGVAATLVSMPLFWHFIDWRPKFVFSRQALEDIMSFGLYETGMNLLSYFTKNIDYLIVGKLLGASLLGIYTLAFTITDVFRQQIMGILNKIMFPVYGFLQDDKSGIKNYYLKIIKFNTILLLVVLMPLLFYAKPAVLLMFGEKWLPAVFPIQAMAVASVIHGIGGTTDAVLRGIGRADLVFKTTSIKIFLFTAPMFIVLIYLYGINGAALAVVFNKLANRIIYQYYMKKMFKISERDIMNTLKDPFIISIVPIILLIVTSASLDLYLWKNFIVAVALVVSVYCGMVYVILKDELKQIVCAVRNKKLSV